MPTFDYHTNTGKAIIINTYFSTVHFTRLDFKDNIMMNTHYALKTLVCYIFNLKLFGY